MSKRKGPPIKHSLEDHQAILDQVAALRAKHPSWTLQTALTSLGIPHTRYQYANERIRLARIQGIAPPSKLDEYSRADLAKPVQPAAYTPSRCWICTQGRAKTMWGDRAVCVPCYEKLKADHADAPLPDEQPQPEPMLEDSEMDQRASRPVPMLTIDESEEAESDEQEIEDEDEDGVLDGMEIEFDDDASESPPAAGAQLVRVFVIEGSVEAVAEILERRFG